MNGNILRVSIFASLLACSNHFLLFSFSLLPLKRCSGALSSIFTWLHPCWNSFSYLRNRKSHFLPKKFVFLNVCIYLCIFSPEKRSTYFCKWPLFLILMQIWWIGTRTGIQRPASYSLLPSEGPRCSGLFFFFFCFYWQFVTMKFKVSCISVHMSFSTLPLPPTNPLT